MIIKTTPLSGLMVIEPRLFQDARGFFLETYQSERYKEAGILDVFTQDNQSRSIKGVLRGMHFQVRHPHAQIVTVMRGHIFDVGVDLRVNSPTFGKWFGVDLCDSGSRQIYMAPGFAHGFCVLSDWADIHYKVSCNYDPSDEGGLNWNDRDVGIEWPIESPIVNIRDNAYPTLKELGSNNLSNY